MLDAHSTFDGTYIAGSFVWPYDPVFRPSVGLFVNGQLTSVFPTARRPGGPDNSDDDRVFFSAPIDGPNGPLSWPEATLTCL
jgi:hypothetical protein